MFCVRVVVLFLTVTSSPAWTFSENTVTTLSPGDDLLRSDNLDSNQNDDIDNEEEDESSKLKISMHDIVTRENENIFFFPIDCKFGNNFETLGSPEIPVEKQNVGYPPYGVNGNFGPQYPVYTYPHRYYYPSSTYAGNGGTYGYNGLGFHPWFYGNDYPMERRYPNPSEYAVNSKNLLRKVRSSEVEDETTTTPEQYIYTTETDDVDAIASNYMKRNYITEHKVISDKLVRKMRSSEVEDQTTTTTPEQDIYTTETDDGDAIASNDKRRNDFNEYEVFSEKLLRKMRSSEVEDETTTTPEQDIYTTENDDIDIIASIDMKRNDFTEHKVISEKLLRKMRSSEMEDETTTTPEQDINTTETDDGDAIASNYMKRNDFTEHKVISEKLLRKMRSSEMEDETTTTPEQDINTTETDDGDAIASNYMKRNDFTEHKVISEKLLRKMRSSEVEDETTTTPEQDIYTTETADEDALSSNNKRRNYFTKRNLKKSIKITM